LESAISKMWTIFSHLWAIAVAEHDGI